MNAELEKATTDLLIFQAQVNFALLNHPGDRYFKIVFLLKDLVASQANSWPGDRDYLRIQVRKIVEAVYSNDPFIEGHHKETAYNLIYPERANLGNFSMDELPELNFSRIPE